MAMNIIDRIVMRKNGRANGQREWRVSDNTTQIYSKYMVKIW